MNSCNCIGPQGGQPVCPCRMRNVKVIDGRYVTTTDLGPAPFGGLPASIFDKASAEQKRLAESRVKDIVTGKDLGPAD